MPAMRRMWFHIPKSWEALRSRSIFATVTPLWMYLSISSSGDSTPKTRRIAPARRSFSSSFSSRKRRLQQSDQKMSSFAAMTASQKASQYW